jgi:hypothetical protein
MPEIRSLIAKLLLPARAGPAFIWAWSHWSPVNYRQTVDMPT